MTKKFFLTLAPLLLVVAASARLDSAAAKPAPYGTGSCGPLAATGTFSEPPDIEMSSMPLNAGGEHELILAVHRDGQRFCYSYRLNGAVRAVAPTIRVRRGEHFALRVVNDISGPSKGESASSKALPQCMPMQMSMTDSPVVHYVGYLNHTIDDRWMKKVAVDTNFHLHGFEGPAAQENVFLSTLSTPMHACEFHVTIPKTQPPGTYFYHPHVHAGSEIQIGGGLAGIWIVEPDTQQIARSNEHILALRFALPIQFDNLFVPDGTALFLMGIRREGTLKAAAPIAYDPFNPPPWPLGYPMKAGGFSLDPTACNGAFAEEVVSIDGHATPISLNVPGGQEQLLRIVDETPDSAKMLELRDSAGNVVPLRVAELDGIPVGGDLSRPLSGYTPVKNLLLAPSQRASILVTVAAGQTVTLSSTHYCAGALAAFQMRHELVRIAGTGQPDIDPPSTASAPVVVADTPASKLVAWTRAHPSQVHRRAITFTEYVFPQHGKIPLHSSYFITETTNKNFREHSYYPEFGMNDTVPERADIVVKKGAIEEWDLINATMETHSFHMHQMAFVELNGPGGAPATVDTTFVPVGKFLPNPKEPTFPLVKPSITKVLLDFRNVPRGTFLFHCHMIFHEDRGMMAIIRVE